jgi:putative tryptophan/tyrosine transport system substrate-binding protein
MRRREFIALIGSAIPSVWRPIAYAQPLPDKKVARLGILSTGPVAARQQAFNAFKDRLRDLGWIEGRNLVIELRWAEGHADHFRELAAELNRLNLDVVVVFGGPAALAAKQSISSTVPIVVITADVVGLGLVAGLARPGANITGVTDLHTELSGKRLELLKEVLPGLTKVSVLWNDSNPGAKRTWAQTEAEGQKLGLRIRSLPVHAPSDLGAAFAALSADHETAALLVVHDPFTLAHRHRIAELAANRQVPAIYGFREFVDAGGLMSYGTNLSEAYRQLATKADKILKGARPDELPVEQPTRFELVISLKAAATLALTIPPAVLARADEVIE